HRSIIVRLAPMDERQRRTEAELEAAFGAARPALLGSLLQVVSGAVRALPTVALDRPPRMADFATFITAAEAALGWPAGRFIEVYQEQRTAAREVTLEASPIAGPLRAFMDEWSEWTGTSGELLN